VRRELIRFGVALVFAAGGALFPSTASRAGLGTMFTQDPCPGLADVAAAYDFRESFVGLPQCESLCRQATASCKQAMKAASTCELAFASDWTAFDSAVDCDGLTGADKKDCRASWSSDLKLWRDQIKRNRDQGGLPTCDNFLNNVNTGCLRRCSGV
jgi:hypothetical protein